MILCKHCGGEECVKNGLIKGKQRYLCRACVKTFRLGDAREKYSLDLLQNLIMPTPNYKSQQLD